jgi:hypothetical protein
MAVALVTATAVMASAHDDIVPYAVGNKIYTGGHDDVTASNTVAERVFGFDFGEDPLDPYNIGDPGFNNGAFGVGVFPNNGLLPANFTLGFNVLTNLEYWDGTGAIAFGAAPPGVGLGVNRGSFTVVVDSNGQSGTAPTIGSTGAAGRLHVHLASQLRYSDGTDPTLPNAPDGIYLIGLELTLPGSGVSISDPLYVLYNNNLSEEQHDAAIEWANTTLVPEPSGALLGVLAGAAAFVWRQVRSRRSMSS